MPQTYTHLRVFHLIVHLSVDDVLGADDAFDDEGVVHPGAGNLLDDDVMTRVHQIASIRHFRFDDGGDSRGQRENRLRPRQAELVAQQQLSDHRFHVTLVGALDALRRPRSSMF